MLIKEYRIPLPFSLGEYRFIQRYAISRATADETTHGEGVTVKENEPFSDHRGSGQYTLKIFHLADRIPGWLKAILPGSLTTVEERAWNAYPDWTYTEYECAAFSGDKFVFRIWSTYAEGAPREGAADKSSKALWAKTFPVDCLDAQALAAREVDVIDIAVDEVAEKHYKESEDPTRFVSRRYPGRGPFLEGWARAAGFPVMCAYKLCAVEFRYWGFQSRVERLVHQSALRAELVKAHRKAACWLDDVPMSDRGIRRYERRVKYELACRIEGTEPTDPPADSESEGEDAEMPALAAAADTAAANGGDDDEYSDGGGFFDAADGPDASFAGVQVWTTPDDVAGARARVRASRPMPKFNVPGGPTPTALVLALTIEDPFPDDGNAMPSAGTHVMRENLGEFAGPAVAMVEVVVRLPDGVPDQRPASYVAMSNDLTPPPATALRQALRLAARDMGLFSSREVALELRRASIDRLERAYEAFVAAHPSFCGSVAVVAEGGSGVAAYDAVGAVERGAAPCGCGCRQPLGIRVDRLVVMGSVLGGVLAARVAGLMPPPICSGTLTALAMPPATLNLFHPSDPCAHRIEPLLDHRFAAVPPEEIPHHRRKFTGIETLERARRTYEDILAADEDSELSSLGSIASTAAADDGPGSSPGASRTKSGISNSGVSMGGEDTEYPATGTTAYWWGRHRIDCSLPPPAVASEVGATYWDSRDVASLIAKVLVPDEPAEADDGSPAPLLVGPACAAGPWLRKRTRLLPGTSNHRVLDSVVGVLPKDADVADAGTWAVLKAKIRYGTVDAHLTGERVAVFIHESPATCPRRLQGETESAGGARRWTRLETTTTTSRHQKSAQLGLDDRGGMAFAGIAAAEARPLGLYPVVFAVVGDLTAAQGTLTVVERFTRVCVFEIDGAVCARVGGHAAVRGGPRGTDSAATGHNRLRNGAHAVAWHLARKGYLIAYLTGRPDYHSASTRRWLAAHEMPVGPILAAGTHGDSMRSRGRAAAMAAAIDRELIKSGVIIERCYLATGTACRAVASLDVPAASVFVFHESKGCSEVNRMGSSYARDHIRAVEETVPMSPVPAPVQVPWTDL